MVLFKIDDIIEDVHNSHRIIIYYIKGNDENFGNNDLELFTNTETALEMLGKKNDDVLIIEVFYNSDIFGDFVNLYRPEITALVTLFAVNNEGIPLISVSICKEENILTAIEQLCIKCNLKEVSKLVENINISKEKEAILEHNTLIGDDNDSFSTSRFIHKLNEDSPPSINLENIEVVSQHHSTRLHIRLPSGVKEEVQFNNDATLQEVWVVISTKFNIKEFDLKTYDHPIFSEDDYDKTLQNLDLCPRGVLIVVNKNVVPFRNRANLIANTHYAFLRVFTLPSFIFRHVQGFLYTFWNYMSRSFNGSTSRRQGDREIKSNNTTSISQSRPSTRKYVSKNIGNNIHTLHRNDDSDDENNRYNGNSTQQK